jgi:hypothetical protein
MCVPPISARGGRTRAESTTPPCPDARGKTHCSGSCSRPRSSGGAGGHADKPTAAPVRPDEKAACSSQTEHRDDRSRKPIRRTIGMPRDAIAIIAIPIHPDPVIGHVAIIAEHGSDFGEKRRVGGEVLVLVGQPRPSYLAVIHPPSPLLPSFKKAQLLHQYPVSEQKLPHVRDPKALPPHRIRARCGRPDGHPRRAPQGLRTVLKRRRLWDAHVVLSRLDVQC